MGLRLINENQAACITAALTMSLWPIEHHARVPNSVSFEIISTLDGGERWREAQQDNSHRQKYPLLISAQTELRDDDDGGLHYYHHYHPQCFFNDHCELDPFCICSTLSICRSRYYRYVVDMYCNKERKTACYYLYRTHHPTNTAAMSNTIQYKSEEGSQRQAQTVEE